MYVISAYPFFDSCYSLGFESWCTRAVGGGRSAALHVSWSSESWWKPYMCCVV